MNPRSSTSLYFRPPAANAAVHSRSTSSFESTIRQTMIDVVAGYTVGDWVRRKGTLPESEALLVVECVADALDYAWDKQRIVHSLTDLGLLPPGVTATSDMTAPLVAAIYAALARSPSMLLMVQAEDLIGDVEQANLPGTFNEHPNWRRRLSVPVEQLESIRSEMTMLGGKVVHQSGAVR